MNKEQMNKEQMNKEEKEKYRKEMIEKFREMWNWIADETEKRQRKVLKYEYFVEHNFSFYEIPELDCYLCEYTKQMVEMLEDDFSNGVDIGEGHTCYNCPIQWGNEGNLIFKSCSLGLYGLWSSTLQHNWKVSSDLARKIANLPEKQEEGGTE